MYIYFLTDIKRHQWLYCVFNLQAQTWCDDGAYLLANQLVDKFQSKEGAQAALRDIEKFLEGAPSMLSSGPDILSIEYEAVITPQMQVRHMAGRLSVFQRQLFFTSVQFLNFICTKRPLCLSFS